MNWQVAEPHRDASRPDVERLLDGAVRSVRPQPHVERVAPTVMAAFMRSQLDGPQARRHETPTAAGDWRGLAPALLDVRRLALPRGIRRVVRPLAAGMLALAVATGGVAASTKAGAPLYPTRLAVEQALLPPFGSTARAAAQLDYADRRLAEAREAAARNDHAATAAAIEAFADEISTLRAEGMPAQAGDGLRGRLRADALTLAALRAAAADPASVAALDRASDTLAALGPRFIRHRHGAISIEAGPGSSPLH
jgi:hypothetical protein